MARQSRFWLQTSLFRRVWSWMIYFYFYFTSWLIDGDCMNNSATDVGVRSWCDLECICRCIAAIFFNRNLICSNPGCWKAEVSFGCLDYSFEKVKKRLSLKYHAQKISAYLDIWCIFLQIEDPSYQWDLDGSGWSGLATTWLKEYLAVIFIGERN